MQPVENVENVCPVLRRFPWSIWHCESSVLSSGTMVKFTIAKLARRSHSF